MNIKPYGPYTLSKNHSSHITKASLLISIIFTSFALGCSSLPKSSDDLQTQLTQAGESIGNFATKLFNAKHNGHTESPAKKSNKAIKRVSFAPALSDNAEKTNAPSLIWPVEKIDISSPFGPRGSRFHGGIDLAAVSGTPIYAAAAGKVVYSGRYSWLFNYGRLVKIQHSPEFETIYAHVKEIYVKAGESVQQGQLVASVGDSGGAHGYHLHFEIIVQGNKVNPEIYLPKRHDKTPETTAASLQPN